MLLAPGRWVAFFSAALTAVASAALSIVLFGTKTWEVMLGVSTLNRSMLLDQGGVDFAQIETLFGALRYFDVSLGLAYRDELEDCRNGDLIGIVGNPDASGEARTVGKWNPAMLDVAEAGGAFLGLRHNSILSERESGQRATARS